MNIKNILLIKTSLSQEVADVAVNIIEWLTHENIEVFELYSPYDDLSDPVVQVSTKFDLAIVLGGDGSSLRGARICAPLSIPIFPINMGHFGFINEILYEEWKEEFTLLRNGKAKIGSYHLLETKIGEESWLSFNDITIYGSMYGTVSIDLFRGQDLITRYRADGLIVSTPTGSTAHSLSAGGPILEHGVEAFIVNPIAPFTLSNRPIILDLYAPLTLSIKKQQRNNALLIIDGRVCLGLLQGSTIQIKNSNIKVSIVHSSKRNYFEILRDKLGWAGEFRA